MVMLRGGVGQPLRLWNVLLTWGTDPHLSLDRTRNLIDECLVSYLQLRSDHYHYAERPVVRHEEDTGLGTPLSTPSRSHAMNAVDVAFPCNIPSPSRAPPPPPTRGSSSGARDGLIADSQPQAQDLSQSIFRSLENYIIACFTSVDCLNTSFANHQSLQLRRAASDTTTVETSSTFNSEGYVSSDCPFPELDAKTLLLGDFAENGMWWAGKRHPDRQYSRGKMTRAPEGSLEERTISRTPRMNWAEVHEWYRVIISVGVSWKERLQKLQSVSVPSGNITILDSLGPETIFSIESDIAEARAHVQRTILKASENILRRPGRPLRKPEDCRFLLILLANPLLSTSDPSLSIDTKSTNAPNSTDLYRISTSQRAFNSSDGLHQHSPSNSKSSTGKHSGLIKRMLGLLANLPSECHHCLVHWFSRYSEAHFRMLVDLVGSFVAYRLTKQHGRNRSDSHDPHGGLIPSLSGPGAGTSAQLHAALGVSGSQTSTEKKESTARFKPSYNDDWQLKAAARVMSLLFSANTQTSSRLQYGSKSPSSPAGRARIPSAARRGWHPHGQLLPTSAFYNSLLDHFDLVADFEAWESRRGNFSFCQYPMFLSIWAKIRIMEHDVRRQMEIKAREAFFHSILNRKAVNQYLVLKVRRECLVEDSLRSVSEIVGTGQDEIKKGLRIDFVGEEGLDSGGLRKEWFLLLVRDVFDPEHGLFVYDEESQYCYFNANSFETSDQFFLIGVVLGLAIYNSTILDVAFPPFAFRKLLASAPNYTGPTTSSIRSLHVPTLDDLAELRPSLARGLMQMLEFDGNVEETFCCDFVAMVDRYGHTDQVPLCSNGENRPVTNTNRHEFVDLYVKYIIDTAVTRQFEPFKRGFFSVCEGNALSLFRPDEIELLVRGSDEPLDIKTLRTVAVYDGWKKEVDPGDEPVVVWFWDSFSRASTKSQRKMLSFITSSDRIPAMGAMCLTIKITCLGDDNDRFPIARTCFNMLGLYRYRSRKVLEDKLWRAVHDSEGFGMK